MNKTAIIIIGIVLIGASFYGGMKYDQSSMASARTARLGQFTGGAGGAGARGGFGGRGAAGGGFAMGQILSKDAQSITIQLTSTSTAPSAGSEIVFLSSSTTISKTTTVPASSLNIGDTVIVTGMKNSDGSVSANSVQLRSAQ